VYKRYHANLDRTFIYGDPDPELVRIHKAAMGALDVLRRTAKAGTPVSVVNRALREYYAEADIWKYHRNPLGYELDASLPPDWCGDSWFWVEQKDDPRTFETSMVSNYENRFRRDVGVGESILEQSPLLALFAAIGLGYALGQISIAGFSLGVGAVLFAGLGSGALAPGSLPPGLVNAIGLAMFLYGVGIQYGPAFFAGLRGPV
jgi:hypothetical protein